VNHKKLIRGSQVAKDQQEDRRRNGWTVLKKTLGEPPEKQRIALSGVAEDRANNGGSW